MTALSTVFASQATVQSTTSASWVTALTAASGSWTAGATYLLVCSGWAYNSSANATYEIQVTHGGTAFDESYQLLETIGASNFGRQWMWHTIYTVPGGGAEDIDIDIQSDGSNTASLDQIRIAAFRVDEDWTLNTDYFTDVQDDLAAPVEQTTSMVDRASITFTPGTASKKWLIFGSAQLEMDNTNQNWEVQITDGTDNWPLISEEGEDNSETRVCSAWRVVTLADSEHTWKVQTRDDGGTNNHNHAHSRITAIELDVILGGVEYAETSTAYTVSSLDTWEKAETLSWTPGTTQNFFILGGALNDFGGTGRDTKVKVDVDDTVMLTGDEDRFIRAYDTTDQMAVDLVGIQSLDNTAHTVDLEVYSDDNTGANFPYRRVVAIGMERAASGDATVVLAAFAVNTTHNAATVTASVEKDVTAQAVTTILDAATVTASVEKIPPPLTVPLVWGAATPTASVEKTPATFEVLTTHNAPTPTASAEVSPAAFEVLTTHNTPTITASVEKTPAAFEVLTTHNTPTLTASVEKALAAFEVLVTHNAPTVTASAFATPGAFEVLVTFEAVSPVVGKTVAPDPLIVTVTFPDPTPTASVEKDLSAFVIPVTFPTVTPSASSAAVASAQAVPITFDGPTVTASVEKALAAFEVLVTHNAPTITASGTATPGSLLVPVTFPAVTASTSHSATPTAFAVNTFFDAATVTASVEQALAAFEVLVTHEAPDVQVGNTVSPAAFAVPITFPAVTVPVDANVMLSAQLVPVTFPDVELPGGEVIVSLNPLRVDVVFPRVNAHGPIVGPAVAAHLRLNRLTIRKLRRQGVWSDPSDDVGV